MQADLAIYSPVSGILDVHGFMESLTGEIQDHGGDIARLSKFISAKQSRGYKKVGIFMFRVGKIVSVSLYPRTG